MNENSDYKTKEIPKPIKERDDSDIETNILLSYGTDITVSDIKKLKEIEKDLEHRKKDLEHRNEDLKHINEDLKHINEDLKTQLKQRKIAFVWVIVLISVYLVCVGVFLRFIFWEFTKTHHTFSPAIVMTLLGTTTATVLGLPYIVLKNLFPHSNEK